MHANIKSKCKKAVDFIPIKYSFQYLLKNLFLCWQHEHESILIDVMYICIKISENKPQVYNILLQAWTKNYENKLDKPS